MSEKHREKSSSVFLSFSHFSSLYLDEQPVGELHDVGLVDRRDSSAAVVARVLEGVFSLYF